MAICWTLAETLEKAESENGTNSWDYWREVQEPKYRPFTWEERNSLKDKWVRYKKANIESQIIGLELFENELLITLSRGVSIKAKDLLEYYEFLNGTPCGVLENN